MNINELTNLSKIGVYCIINTVNGKRYVGSTASSFKQRFMQHIQKLRRGAHANKHLQASFLKYGESSFRFEILEIVETSEGIRDLEKHYIEVYKAVEEGYNENPDPNYSPMLNGTTQQKVSEGMKNWWKETKKSMSEEAFREALANAIIHRVWDINSHIRVSMFDDRVEIVSVGGLPNSVAVDSYLSGDLSVLRNPILANVFHRLKLIEKFGTGIRRIKEAYTDSQTKPSFEVTESIIKVTLPLLSEKMDLTQDELAVYSVLSKNINKPISEIMSSPGIEFGKSKVTEILKRLANKKFVDIEGNGRGTKYRKKT